MIFEPREVKVKGSKFIDLKGSNDRFGLLSIAGELYLWGNNAKILFDGFNHKQVNQNSYNWVTQPHKVDLDQFVLDFEME